MADGPVVAPASRWHCSGHSGEAWAEGTPSSQAPYYLCQAQSWRTRCFSTFSQPGGSVDACLCVRRLYGDESELHFWTVAAHYLHSSSQDKATSTPAAQEAAPRDRASNPLDICYDVLCENAYFQVW